MMRTLAIGDIHGCLRALTTMETFVGFSPHDRIITLGDYVGRGPDTRGVLDWLVERSQRYQLVPLKGNHEIMMLAAGKNYFSLESWLNVAGQVALDSYSTPDTEAALDDVPQSHWRFLEGLQPYFETETHIFAHANLLPDKPLQDQPDEVLYWTSFEAWPGRHQSGKTLICGHTSQKDGLPKVRDGGVCIDTWACGEGWLTCLDVDTGHYWQTNQRGDSRTGHLDQLS